MSNGSPTSQNRHPIRNRHDLAQFVGDKDHRPPAIFEAPEGDKQVVTLLWRQDRRGLVKDEDLRIAVEGLEDLHPLQDPNRQIFDPSPRVDHQPIFGAKCTYSLGRFGAIQEDPGARLVAKYDVLGHRQSRKQLEGLMDHAQAGGDRIQGRVEAHGSSVDHDFARVGRRQSIEDRHQRGLAGSVLTDDGVNVSPAHLQIDVVIGANSGEALADPPEFERVGHSVS